MSVKSIIFVLLLALSSFSLFAKEISVSGFGDSEEVARQNARLSLLEYIFGVYVHDDTYLLEKENIDDFTSHSRIKLKGNLICTQYFISKQGDSNNTKYVCNAKISLESKDLILKEIAKIKNNIMFCLSVFKNTQSISDNIISLLCDEINKYVDYSKIVSILDENYKDDMQFVEKIPADILKLIIDKKAEMEKQE